MRYTYRPKGVCSSKITFDLNDGVVGDVQFEGGCNGNLKAIALLVDGMKAQDLIDKLKGNTCGFRATSCADQLATAVLEAIKLV